jgi:Flp pilus assembly protein TadG
VTPRRRARDQAGTALVEFSWLAILLLVPLVYVLLAVFDVQRASYGVSAATRAAGRAFVLAPDLTTARLRAAEAAAVALRDQGIGLPAGALSISCLPTPASCLQPGSAALVALHVQVPLPLLPDALGGGRPSIRVSSTHLAPYGTFREAR